MFYTPDQVDPVELERCELIAAGAMLYLSYLGERQAGDLVGLGLGNALERLAGEHRRARASVVAAAEEERQQVWLETRSFLAHAVAREEASLASLRSFHQFQRPRNELDSAIAALRATHSQLFTSLVSAAATRGVRTDAPAEGAQRDARVPRRLTRGPLDFDLPESRLEAERKAWYASDGRALGGDLRFELVNFIDGARSVSDIRDALSAEFAPMPLEVVARYLDDLALAQVVGW